MNKETPWCFTLWIIPKRRLTEVVMSVLLDRFDRMSPLYDSVWERQCLHKAVCGYLATRHCPKCDISDDISQSGTSTVFVINFASGERSVHGWYGFLYTYYITSLSTQLHPYTPLQVAQPLSPTTHTYPQITIRGGRMSRASTSRSGRSENLKFMASNPDHAVLNPGWVKRMTLKLILVAP